MRFFCAGCSQAALIIATTAIVIVTNSVIVHELLVRLIMIALTMWCLMNLYLFYQISTFSFRYIFLSFDDNSGHFVVSAVFRIQRSKRKRSFWMLTGIDNAAVSTIWDVGSNSFSYLGKMRKAGWFMPVRCVNSLFSYTVR